MSDLSTVHEKIKKLLALTESPNIHEAATAARKARELMLTHSLEMEMFTKDENPFKDIFEVPFTHATPIYWKTKIWNSLADYCVCKLCVNWKGQICVIGKEENTTLFKELYHYLFNTIHVHTAAQKKMKKDLNALSFREGWAAGLSAQLAKRDDTDQIKAMVVSQMSILNDYA
jgi:hypothetical protein